LNLEIDKGLAREYVDAIYNAFSESGNEIPKHLGDALCSIELQLNDANEQQ
jgi:hypothetical protein